MNKNVVLCGKHLSKFANELVIGPWIFQEHENIEPSFYKKSYTKILDSTNAKHHASLACSKEVQSNIKELSRNLNKANNTNFDEHFWMRVAGYSNHLLIQIAYVRYLYIKKFIQNTKDIRKTSVVAPQKKWYFKSVHSFGTTTSGAEFDYWLSSFIVSELRPENWELIHDKSFSPRIFHPVSTSSVSYQSNSKETKSSGVYLFIKNKILNFIKNNQTVSIPGSEWKFNLFCIFLTFLIPKLKSSKERNILIPPSPSDLPDEFKRIYYKIKSFIKISNLENGFIAEVIKKNKYPKTGIYVSPSDAHDDEKNIIKAYHETKGVQVINIQHGSGYGVRLGFDASYIYEFSQNVFLTWGWDKYFDFLTTKFIPLPVPILLKQKRSRPNQEKSGDLLFFDISYNLRSARLDGLHLPHETLAEINNRNKFFKALRKRIRKKVVYRPHVFHSNQIDSEQILLNEGLKFKSFKSISLLELTDKMLDAKLLVSNHFGTTFHYALAWNIPIVCYWEPGHMEVCDNVAELFLNLKQAKIIFSSYEDAVVHINKTFDNIDKWWLSEEVQLVRKEFCKTHSFATRAWIFHWIKFLVFDSRKLNK